MVFEILVPQGIKLEPHAVEVQSGKFLNQLSLMIALSLHYLVPAHSYSSVWVPSSYFDYIIC